jgi:hypothetical protein
LPPGPRRIASRICPDLISDRHKDDDDHEIDTRHLLPGWLKEVLTEVKGLAAKIKAHLQGDEDGDIIVLEATEEQIVGILKVVTANNDRDEARHKAKAKYEEMVEAKVEACGQSGRAYPGESLGIKPFHFAGDPVYDDDDIAA